MFPADLFYSKAVKILMAAHIISCLKTGRSTDNAWIYRKKSSLGLLECVVGSNGLPTNPNKEHAGPLSVWTKSNEDRGDEVEQGLL